MQKNLAFPAHAARRLPIAGLIACMPLVKPVGNLFMMPPQIRCNHSSSMLQPYVFFILCKGDNAGKPGFKPWANCFSVSCNNQQSFEFYFWLMYGLFHAGKFKLRHRGTAIQFINLNDVRDVIAEAAKPVYSHWQQYQQILAALSKLEQKKVSLAEQVIATERMQKHLINSYFNK